MRLLTAVKISYHKMGQAVTDIYDEKAIDEYGVTPELIQVKALGEWIIFPVLPGGR
ncbi:MAG: hypothetical protein ACLS5X_00685 [Eubacterium sp.]